LSQHCLEQARYRGCNEEEIIQTIRDIQWEKAELGRLQCQKNFTFNKIWNGKEYAVKQVKPIFMEESGEVIVITVYVYYF